MKLKIAAKAIIAVQGKVLIMSDNGKWDFPGGGIEGDERLQDALKRELLEETGFTDVSIGIVVHADEWTMEKRDQHVIAVYYSCSMHEQASPVLSEEHSDYAWILPSELINYDATPDTIRALEATEATGL